MSLQAGSQRALNAERLERIRDDFVAVGSQRTVILVVLHVGVVRKPLAVGAQCFN